MVGPVEAHCLKTSLLDSVSPLLATMCLPLLVTSNELFSWFLSFGCCHGVLTYELRIWDHTHLAWPRSSQTCVTLLTGRSYWSFPVPPSKWWAVISQTLPVTWNNNSLYPKTGLFYKRGAQKGILNLIDISLKHERDLHVLRHHQSLLKSDVCSCFQHPETAGSLLTHAPSVELAFSHLATDSMVLSIFSPYRWTPPTATPLSYSKCADLWEANALPILHPQP